MTVERRVLAGSLAILLLVAACGGSASSAPTTAPGQSVTPGSTQEPSDTQEPGDTQEPTDGPDITFTPGGAGDLEALLPSEVNGVKFEKGSFDGGSVPGGSRLKLAIARFEIIVTAESAFVPG